MRSKLTKITLTAGIALALAFTFNACGNVGEEDPSGGSSSSGTETGNESSSGVETSSSSEQAHVHTYGDWEVTTAATCTATGTETRTCTGDHTHTETRDIPIDPNDHDWEILSGTPATCSATGYGEEKCKRCGKSVIGELPIDSHAHNWGSWASKSLAMCTEKEVEERVCSHNALHREEQSVGEPLGHDDGTWHQTLAPTCTADGSRELLCNRDNEVLEISTVAQLTWNAWAQTTAPTCTAAGVETRTCPGNASPAQNQPITQLAWNAWTVTTPATPTTVGLETRTCPGNASTPETRTLYPKCNGVDYDPAEKFCDERDYKLYKYVTIGTGATAQIWMAENLNFNATGSRCYGDNTGGDSQNRCGTYGRLYNWNTAMGGAASSIAEPSGVQGVCPSGWHLPSGAEWNVLMKFVNPSCSDNADCVGAGTKLKAASDWNSYSGIPAGTDNFGFSALPGGHGDPGGFFDVGNIGSWWSASESSSGNAYRSNMNYNNDYAYWNFTVKSSLRSVRCVRD